MNGHEEMTALGFLIGRWKTEGYIRATGGRAASSFSGTDTYEWTLGSRFLLHKVDVMMQDERTEAIELIGEWNPQTNRYTLRSFDNQGTYTQMEAWLDKAGAFHILGTNMRAVLRVNDADTLSAHWDRSDDNENWQPWMELTLSK